MSFIVLDTDVASAILHAQMRGRARPANDTWIAACCLARELPLATLNIKDFIDVGVGPRQAATA